MYYILILLVMALSLFAQTAVTRTFNEYAKIPAARGIAANDMARRLLRSANSGVQVTQVSGSLTDHYNPQTGVVGLSDAVYSSDSVAALAVAAHEIGHVMQYEENYLPIKLRNTILPVANLGSMGAPYIVILGVLFNSYNLAMIGVWLFLAILLFQFVTLPVEFNASRRAVRMLEDGGYLAYDEAPGAKKVLRAAAMTYVMATLAALISFLRLFALANSTRRR